MHLLHIAIGISHVWYLTLRQSCCHQNSNEKENHKAKNLCGHAFLGTQLKASILLLVKSAQHDKNLWGNQTTRRSRNKIYRMAAEALLLLIVFENKARLRLSRQKVCRLGLSQAMAVASLLNAFFCGV